MRTCSKCGKKFGLFSRKVECRMEECEKVWCSDCAEKTTRTCESCNDIFCLPHSEGHSCDTEEEADEQDSRYDLTKQIKSLTDRQLLEVILRSLYYQEPDAVKENINLFKGQIYPDRHEAIITPELFDKAQKRGE